jgi:hypothetical protein
VSSRTITHVQLYTKSLVVAWALLCSTVYADWTVDFSRRQQEVRTQELRAPASSELPQQIGSQEPPGFFQSLFESNQVAGELVVLNTDKGFIPSTIRVKKGLAYRIHVVNVNDKEKNVSFVLDSFSEHHATYYGKIKSFVIRPQKEGVFKFVSPETAAQRKLVVYPPEGDSRMPASSNE